MDYASKQLKSISLGSEKVIHSHWISSQWMSTDIHLIHWAAFVSAASYCQPNSSETRLLNSFPAKEIQAFTMVSDTEYIFSGIDLFCKVIEGKVIYKEKF